MGPGIISSLLSGKGKTKTVTNVKNPALQRWIDQGITDYAGIRAGGQEGLADWVQSFIADKPSAAKRSAEEIANLDRYYSGAAANQLGALGRAEDAAYQAAADRAAGMVRANRSRAEVGGGGPDTYYDRLALRNTGDIMTNAAANAASRDRAQWEWMERMKSGLSGQRQSLADAYSGRALLPSMMARNMERENMGHLGSLGELDRGNKFYGLKYEPTTWERVSQGVNQDLNATMSMVSSIMSSMRGGGAGYTPPQSVSWGGAPTANQMYGLGAGGGPMSTAGANNFASSVWGAGSGAPLSSTGLW